MKIVESKHIEDCFDGSYVYELSLSEPMTELFIRSLATGSELQYFPDFARPFFRVLDDNFTIKGIQGNQVIRVIAFGSFEKTLCVIESRTRNYQVSNVI